MVKLSERDQQQLEKAKDLMESGAQETGFFRSLFFGRLRLDKLMPYPQQDPADAKRTDELLDKVDRYMREHVNADRIDKTERIPQTVIRGLGKLGVLGMTVPKEYGGGGYSHTAYCRVLERIAMYCSSTAVLVGAHQSIGLKALILSGTEEQKRTYLPDLASGRKLAAFALTEPEAGSDAANVQTRAEPSKDGKWWFITGEKKFITNGALAGMMTVMARTEVTINGAKHDKVTAFIVTPDMPGFEVVKPNRSKCGIRGTWQATLKFNRMKVPAKNILGELGRGLKVALTVLDFGRCTLSAGCIGGAKVALDKTIEHVKSRQQFDRRLADFEAVQHKIARMAELTFAMDAMTYLAAGMVDRHDEDLMLETAATKLFCSETSWRVIDDAVQLHGGEGYMRDGGLERMLRDARINRIVEGATEVMTSFVALMGMKGVGEELEQVLKAARHPWSNLDRLKAFARHEWRDVILGPAATGLHPKLAREGRMLTKLTRELARSVTRLLAKHQTKILDMQLLQQRVAWAAVELYAMTAVVSRMQSMIVAAESNGGVEHIARDLTIGKGFCDHAAGRIHQRLRGLFGNRDAKRLAVARSVLGLNE
ncbi:MAG: acyl-CoA dehydrogenase [Planctomycetes bacterium]|nr:acyl-CoA dehydrogenase [Planctomycetota bacterium]